MVDASLALLTLGAIEDNAIPLVAIGGGLVVGAIGIIAGTVSAVSNRKQREESRREIAAYVAEGSMSPDDAATLLSADMPAWEKGRCGK